jgi:hypothetical protein
MCDENEVLTMTTYEASIPVSNRPVAQLEVAMSILAGQGFEVTHRDATSAALRGPGLNSSRQNPLLGATHVELRLESEELRLYAKLGGVDAMRRWLMWFPFVLGLGLGLFFALAGGVMFGRQFVVPLGDTWNRGWRWIAVAFAAALVPVSPWLVLSPLIARQLRRRTERALNTLLKNSTGLSQFGS